MRYIVLASWIVVVALFVTQCRKADAEFKRYAHCREWLKAGQLAKWRMFKPQNPDQ